MQIRLIDKKGHFTNTVEAVNNFSEGSNQLIANLINKLIELKVLDCKAVEEVFFWEVEAEEIG